MEQNSDCGCFVFILIILCFTPLLVIALPILFFMFLGTVCNSFTGKSKTTTCRLIDKSIEDDIACMYMSMNPEQRKRADVMINNFDTHRHTVAIRLAEIIVDPKNQFYNEEHFFNKYK